MAVPSEACVVAVISFILVVAIKNLLESDTEQRFKHGQLSSRPALSAASFLVRMRPRQTTASRAGLKPAIKRNSRCDPVLTKTVRFSIVCRGVDVGSNESRWIGKGWDA